MQANSNGIRPKLKATSQNTASAFEAARRVFDDVFADERCDFDSAPGEVRYVITGRVNDVVLRVVYTERGDRIRIISARKATAHEEEEYYRSQTSE